MSKSNKYGYSGVDIPTQAFQANVGKFDPAEINELVQEDKWTQYGQLELIETQTVSGASAIDFTSIQGSTYNVHFLTYNDLQTASASIYTQMRLSNDSGTSFETSNYQRAVQYMGINGTFGESRSTSTDRFSLLSFTQANNPMTGYVYFYNLGDSSKYSFITHQNAVNLESSTVGWSYFGSQVYKVAETIDAIRIMNSGSSVNFTSGSVSLYGIRYS